MIMEGYIRWLLTIPTRHASFRSLFSENLIPRPNSVLTNHPTEFIILRTLIIDCACISAVLVLLSIMLPMTRRIDKKL